LDVTLTHSEGRGSDIEWYFRPVAKWLEHYKVLVSTIHCASWLTRSTTRYRLTPDLNLTGISVICIATLHLLQGVEPYSIWVIVTLIEYGLSVPTDCSQSL
jgi:hypothetical protein